MVLTKEHTYRGELINELIIKHKLSSVLELGVDAGFTWNQLKFSDKTGIDSNKKILEYELNDVSKIVITTTDNFFSTNTRKFDLIFIDAYHEKLQVYRDFQNSFECLNDNGIILLHDIFPKNKQGTVISGHGDIFELWMGMYESYELYTHIDINNDDTVGIFYKTLNPIWHDLFLDDFEHFWANRAKYIYDICQNRDYNGENLCLKKY